MGLVADLRSLDSLEKGVGPVCIHYEIIPNSEPPFLACMYVGGVLVRPHLTGFPAQLRRILVGDRRKVVSDGPFREAVEGRYLWGQRIAEMDTIDVPQYYAEASQFYWGDAIYPEGAISYLEMRVSELERWVGGKSIVPRPPPKVGTAVVQEISIKDESNRVKGITVCRVRSVDFKPFYPVHLMNANLLSYLKEYTFSPSDEVYRDWFDSVHYKSTAAISNTAKLQVKNHARMLGRGSTQVNTCTNAVTVGTFVRIDIRVLGKPEQYTFDPYGESVNGSVPWSDKAYKVISVIDGTDVSPKKYVLQDLKGSYFRGVLCPIESLEMGAIVRIRLSTLAKWLMANGTVKVRERHFAYNHSYSRALFRIAQIGDIPEVGMRYFLELVWSPVSTFKFSEWEVDERQNLWSYEHYEQGLGVGVKPFTGFQTMDLLRVDQQTEVLMRTGEGQDKYRECLLKCMNLGKKATYMDDKIAKKRMKKDPIDGSRTKKWKTSLGHNEELRRRVIAGLPVHANIFQLPE